MANNQPIRLPLVVANQARDSSRLKDSWGTNCFTDGQMSRQRPGLVRYQSTSDGVLGLGLFSFDGVSYALQNTQGPIYSTWTQGGSLPAGQVVAEVAGTGRWVVAVFNGTDTKVYWSTDGNVWNYSGLQVAIANCSLAYNAGVFVFITAGTSTYYTSPDGASWTSQIQAAGTPERIVVAGGYFLMTLVGIAFCVTGTDGVVWTSHAVPESGLFPRGLLDNKFYLIKDSSNTYYQSSDHGATWVTKTVPYFFISGLAYAPGIGYVYTVIDAASWAYTSTDLVTWAGPYYGVGGLSDTLTYTAGKFYVQGTSGALNGSVDGTIWATETMPVLPHTSFTMPVLNQSLLLSIQNYYSSYTVPPVAYYRTPVVTQVLTVSGTTQYDVVPGYNGVFLKNTTNAYWFSAVTKTITAITDINYPALTVPGAAFLDGTYYVMDPTGKIWGSRLNDATAWDPLNVISVNAVGESATKLQGHLNYVIAFMSGSTHFFYDAGNPTGSPLLPYTSANMDYGCPAAGSIQEGDNRVYWIGDAGPRGRSVFMMEGTGVTPVSTPAIDRILNAAPMASVTAFTIAISGSFFYVVNLPGLPITLAMDVRTRDWKEWTYLTPGTTLTGATATYGSGVITVVLAGHGLATGDIATISGFSPSAYNGTFLVDVVDSSHFTYTPLSEPGVTPAIGSGAVLPYTSGVFPAQSYASLTTDDLVQDANAQLYYLDPTAYSDFASPIDMKVRTQKLDGGSILQSTFPDVNVISDKATALAYFRYSDDDYQTWSNWFPVNLSLERSMLTRLGSARRRAFELRYIDNAQCRFEALELDPEKGVN